MTKFKSIALVNYPKLKFFTLKKFGKNFENYDYCDRGGLLVVKVAAVSLDASTLASHFVGFQSVCSSIFLWFRFRRNSCWFSLIIIMSEDNVEEVKPIDKWDGSAVKNCLDDNVKYFITEKKDFEENFKLIDIRLTISLAAVGVAVFALIYDYLNPFPLSRHVLLFCVLTYFVFMALLTVYTTFCEKGIFLKADQYNSDRKVKVSLTISSYMKRFDDQYQLLFEIKDQGEKREEKLESSVANWFDEEGYFLDDRFENDIEKLYKKLFAKKSN